MAISRNSVIKKCIKLPAEISELAQFINWLDSNYEACNFPVDKKSKFLVCAEEIFVNIAYYAYPKDLKNIEQNALVAFEYSKKDNQLSLVFTDSGIKYNPLEKEDPDITQNINERKTGGLGIYMVKQIMDSVEYRYENCQNILTLKMFAH